MSKFKIGDRVRVIEEVGYEAPQLQAGAVGTVGYVSGHAIGVHIDDYREPMFDEGGWNYYPESLEVINE